MFNEIVNIAVGINDGFRDPSNYGLRLKLRLVMKNEWELRLVLSIIDYHLLSTLCVASLFGGRGGKDIKVQKGSWINKNIKKRTIEPSKSKQPN